MTWNLQKNSYSKSNQREKARKMGMIIIKTLPSLDKMRTKVTNVYLKLKSLRRA